MEYKYQLLIGPNGTPNNNVKRLPDGAIIPDDPENTDWQAYQVWIEQGNQPLPPDGA